MNTFDAHRRPRIRERPLVHDTVASPHTTSVRRRVVRRLLALTTCSSVVVALAAGPALALSTTPDVTWMANGRVYTSVKLGNTLFIGGLFTKIQPASGQPGTAFTAGGLGAIDMTTGQGIPGWTHTISRTGTTAVVRALALSADGSAMYVGGNFDAIDGIPVWNLARIDMATNQVDPTFDPQVGSDTSHVFTILPASTKIYFGGLFGSVDGQTRGKLAAVALDGTLDPNWKPSANGKVQSLIFDSSGGTMFVAGHFSTINGVSRQCVARLSLDTGAVQSWAIPSGTITAPQTGWTLIATSSRLYGGFGAHGPNYLASFRLDNGNSGDQLWRFYTVGNVQTIAMNTAGDKLFFGGHFGLGHLQQTVCNNIPLHGLASVNPSNGAFDCTWVPQLEPYGNNFNGPWTIQTTSSYVWVGGGYKKIAGVEHLNLARFTL